MLKKALKELLSHVWVVVIAGGKGTRLFPLSTPSKEKQFCMLGDNYTFLQKTIKNFLSLGVDASHIIVVVSNDHQVKLAEEQSAKVGLPPENIWNIGEGDGFYGSMVVAGNQIGAIDEHAILINTPADHFLKVNEIFANVMEDAIKGARKGCAVLLGVKSHNLATIMSCGNIIYKEVAEGCFPVRSFIEKPEEEDKAKQLADYGCAVCSTGISVWHTQTLQKFAPRRTQKKLGAEEFLGRFKSNLKVAVGKYPWQDCGTFRGFYESLGKTGTRHNAVMGNGEFHVSSKVKRSFLYSDDDLVLIIDDDVEEVQDAACVLAGTASNPIVLVIPLDDSRVVSQLAEQYNKFGKLLTNNFFLGVKHVSTDVDDSINAAIGIVKFDNLHVEVYKDQNNGGKTTARISKRKQNSSNS